MTWSSANRALQIASSGLALRAAEHGDAEDQPVSASQKLLADMEDRAQVADARVWMFEGASLGCLHCQSSDAGRAEALWTLVELITYTVATGDQEFVEKLEKKHGSNYAAMARDGKLNVYQVCPASLATHAAMLPGGACPTCASTPLESSH